MLIIQEDNAAKTEGQIAETADENTPTSRDTTCIHGRTATSCSQAALPPMLDVIQPVLGQKGAFARETINDSEKMVK